MSAQTFVDKPNGKKQGGMKFGLVRWLCNETKMEDHIFQRLVDNQVHDDNVEYLHTMDLVDMGVPLAPAK